MLSFKRLAIEDKPLFNSYWIRNDYTNWELSFTTLFIWRNGWELEIAYDENAAYLKGFDKLLKRQFFFPPVCAPEAFAASVGKCLEYARECGEGWVLRGITTDMKQKIEETGLEFRLAPETMDYVYLTDELIELRGKKFHSKRNHLNRFMMDNPGAVYSKLTEDDFQDCIELSEKWLSNRDEITWDLEDERDAIASMFACYSDLGVCGGTLRVGKKLAAFTVGELLNPEMALVHLEKGNPELTGVYAVINQQFLANEFSGIKYVNREDDMCLPGLMKAKQSYHPVMRIEKYDAALV